MPSYLVTGASRGLGYAWITHLASSSPSNQVFALVRNAPATSSRLAQDGISNVHVLSADITDYAALQSAAEEVTKTTEGGGLDVLIHNAAYVSRQSAWKTVVEEKHSDLVKDLNESWEANVIGTANVLSAFLPLVRKGQTKKIMVISTGMADLDLVNKFSVGIGGPYSISKAAANLLVAKYHAAVGEAEGILVFSISPGLVDTSEGKEPSEEDIRGGQAMGAKFAEYAPHFRGPITPKESVEYQEKVLDRATVKEFGGSFVSHFGNKQWL